MGHMMVGPQLYPARPQGAQIIQRGPHGKHFAPDPVAVRRANPGANGFTWWSEEMARTGGDTRPWLPRQIVEGVMGLGAVSSELSALQNKDYAAFQARSRNLFPTRPSVISGVTKLRTLSAAVTDARTATRAADYGVLLREANMMHGGAGSRERGQTISSLSVAAIRRSGAVREDSSPMITSQVLPTPGAAYTSTLKDELSRQFNPLDPRSADWGGGSREGAGGGFPWGKATLALVGVVAAYGFARGAGGNIF